MTVLSLQLRRSDGLTVSCRGRPLEHGDVAAVLALHLRLVQDMPSTLVATETPTFFDEHVASKGRMFGLFDEAALVAYAVLGLPAPGDANFGVDHALSVGELAAVAHLDGAGVDPRYRGNGLQKLLIGWRLDAARAAGRSIALSTVAPRNTHSLDNMNACGLAIRQLVVKFGGWRYLMRRDLDRAAWPLDGEGGRWVSADDLDAQGALLGAGLRGWRARGEGAGRDVLFAPAGERPVSDWAAQRVSFAGAAGMAAALSASSRQ